MWGWYHPQALQGSEHSLLSCETIQEVFFSTLSLEYSVFTHGNLQGKHHSGFYQRIMCGITFPEALELKDKATSLMADGSCGFLEASASGVR